MEDLARQVGNLTLNQASNNEPEDDKNPPESQVDNPNDTNQPSDDGHVATNRTIQSSDDDAVATGQTEVLSETINPRDVESVAKDQIATSDDEEMSISQDNIFNSTSHPMFDDDKTIADSDSFNNTSLSRIEDMTGTFLSSDEDIAMSQSDITDSLAQISDDNDTTDQAETSNNTIQPSHDEDMVIDQDNNPPHTKYQITHDYTQLPSEPASINVFYANAQSICADGKLDELKCIIKMIPKTVHLILITETHATKKHIIYSSLGIENYILVLGNRVDKIRGGVAAYVHRDVQYSHTEITYMNGNHYLWVFFNDPSLKSIGVVYYPGDSNSTTGQQIFLKDFKQQLTRQRDCNAVVLGDFNINVLETRKSSDFKNVLKETAFEILNDQSEKYFTRVNIKNCNITKKSVIDLVCSNIKGIDFHLALIDSSLSDHRQVYFEIRNPEKFLENQPLDSNWRKSVWEAKNSKAENEDLHSLEDEMIQIINKFSKDVRQDDWITDKICKNITKKNRLHQKYQKCPKKNKKLSVETNEAVKDKIKNRKKEYEILTLIENGFNKKIIPSTITKGSKYISKKENICKEFNNHFAKISTPKELQTPKMTSGVNASSKHNNIKRLSVLPPCTPKEINKIILSLDPYLGAGVFGIDVTKIRLSNNRKEISNALCTCFNKYFETGFFPDCLKISKVIPVHKGGLKSELQNYTFEQVLPVFARILEKLIWKRIHSFIPVHYVTENQYGYRKKANTASRTIDIISKINTSIHENNVALGMFIDLKEAFNNVDHALLLSRLEDLGVDDPGFKILKSYLHNRNHVVTSGRFESELKNISRGLPQGSILGHLLFLIYINGVSNLNLNGEITLSPEKISLFYYGRIEDYKADRDLGSISKWFRENGLTIDPRNVCYVIFTYDQNFTDNYDLKLDNTKIEGVEKVKFFGLTLDSKLTWTSHVENIKEKLKLVAKVSLKDISNNAGSALYNACLKPYINYLKEIWGTDAEAKSLDGLLSPLLNQLKKCSPKLNKTPISTEQNLPTDITENLVMATERASGSGSTTKKKVFKSPISERKKKKETGPPGTKKSSKKLNNVTL